MSVEGSTRACRSTPCPARPPSPGVPGPPLPPRNLVPGSAVDLRPIVRRGLAKEPAGRYPSAAPLADDLAAFREGRPIVARRPGPALRAMARLRRHPRVAVAAALAIPQVAIFGSTNPDWTAPLNPKAAILYRGEPCSPCYGRTCHLGHTRCLTEISPEEVLAAARPLLG